MATLNVFSQTLHPTISSSFCCSSSNSNYAYFCPNSNTSKFHFFSNSLLSSLSAPTLSNSSKTHYSKSGTFSLTLTNSFTTVILTNFLCFVLLLACVNESVWVELESFLLILVCLMIDTWYVNLFCLWDEF